MLEKYEHLVEMEEMAFTCDNKTDLITLGISTCIGFVIQGKYEDETTEKLVPFCGLFHWSGFELSTQDPLQCTRQVFEYFLDKLRFDLGLEDNQRVNIKKLLFIGGEKAEYDEHQEMTLTGTEAEVMALKHVITNFNFTQRNFTVQPENIEHHHFLTQENKSIDIILNVTDFRPQINDNLDTSLDNIELSTALCFV